LKDPKISSGQLAWIGPPWCYHGGGVPLPVMMHREAPLQVVMHHPWPNGHGDALLFQSFGEEFWLMAAGSCRGHLMHFFMSKLIFLII